MTRRHAPAANVECAAAALSPNSRSARAFARHEVEGRAVIALGSEAA